MPLGAFDLTSRFSLHCSRGTQLWVYYNGVKCLTYCKDFNVQFPFSRSQTSFTTVSSSFDSQRLQLIGKVDGNLIITWTFNVYVFICCLVT